MVRIHPNLLVNVLFGTLYIKKCILGIFPMECEIVPKHFAPVAMLGRDTKANVTNILWLEGSVNEQN